MPLADYASTARSLALPIDDDLPDRRSRSPLWRRRGSGSFTSSPALDGPAGFRARVYYNADKYTRQARGLFMRLTPLQRVAVIIAVIITFVLSVLFLVYNEKIFGLLEPSAERWKQRPGGWLLLWFLCFFVSFPPLIGYSSIVTISGFIYGVPNSWFIVASATICGSTASFFVSRTVLSQYTQRLAESNKRFAALSLTLKHDGLKLLCMIRLCPLPYSFSNGAISTIPTVKWYNFMLATAIASPKLFIHCFIGSQLGDLAKNGDHMSAKARTFNYLSIAFGAILGIATAWIIYQQTKARAQELEAQEAENAQNDRPSGHGRQYSDDPAEEQAARTLRRDDDISLHDQDDNEYRDFLEDDDGLDDDDPFGRHNDEESGRPSRGR